MRHLIITILLCCWAVRLSAQTYTATDSAEVVSLLMTKQHSPLYYAKKLIGRPYVAHTLEVNDEECLVVNLRQLDCTTLVENTVALALCARHGHTAFSDFVDMLQLLRYRQGLLDGYVSRLHYFSDWIRDKQSLGLVQEINLPAPPFNAIQTLDINYMSRHPNAYKALKAHPEYLPVIARQEQSLSGLSFRYIPKALTGNASMLRQVILDGDIIAITTSKPGLDIAHLGLAVWQNNELHLLNASQLHKKVVIEPMTLYQYLAKHPSHTGIRIIRIK